MKTRYQIILYLFIGGGITIAEILGFYVLYEFFGIHYILASIIMFVLASAAGIVLYRYFIFGASHLRVRTEVIAVYGINLVGIGLNTLILWICVRFFACTPLIGKIIASLLVAFYGFYARKFFIYKKEKTC